MECFVFLFYFLIPLYEHGRFLFLVRCADLSDGSAQRVSFPLFFSFVIGKVFTQSISCIPPKNRQTFLIFILFFIFPKLLERRGVCLDKIDIIVRRGTHRLFYEVELKKPENVHSFKFSKKHFSMVVVRCLSS